MPNAGADVDAGMGAGAIPSVCRDNAGDAKLNVTLGVFFGQTKRP